MEPPFPYEPRCGQRDIVLAFRESLEERRHCIAQAGTGTGKTICALSAAVSCAAERGCKVLYLTRTNSQQRQVISELRAISRLRPLFGTALQGRHNMCPHAQTDDELKHGTHDELSRLCGQRKSRVLNGDHAACRYYHALISGDCATIISWARDNLPTAEEFAAHCTDRGICPYELNKQLLPLATVVTAPYIYFFNPFIRHSLLEWMCCQMEDLIVIVDEAHNLPDYARELRTVALSQASLRLADREARELRDPEVSEGTSATDLLKMTSEILDEALEEFVVEDDGLVPSGLLEESLMGRLRLTSRGVLKLASELVNLGEIVRDRRRKEGHLPRSYLYAVGGFIEAWMSVSEEDYVKLVVAGENPRLEAYCLDPALACACIHETAGSLHMSGTLEPLEEYRDSIGLPKDSTTYSFPSPFPKQNLLKLYVDDTTSRYEEFARDDRNICRMKEYISSVMRAFDKNLAVFFPSHSMLQRFVDAGLLEEAGAEAFVERQGMPQEELMEIVSGFKGSENGALMLSVAGGRISEGIDFPDRELEIAIIAGVPYPKPTSRTRALQHYYELKFGKGWEYVVKAPATRKILQCIGRLIRSEEDRGAALILDRRAVHFSQHIQASLTSDPVSEITRFFQRSIEQPRISLPRRRRPRLKLTLTERSVQR